MKADHSGGRGNWRPGGLAQGGPSSSRQLANDSFVNPEACHPPTDGLKLFWPLLICLPLSNPCEVCAPGPEGADGSCKNLRREEQGSTRLKAAWSLAASQTDLHRIRGPPLTYSRHLINALSRKETTTCSLAARGTPYWVRSNPRRIILACRPAFYEPPPSAPVNTSDWAPPLRLLCWGASGGVAAP